MSANMVLVYGGVGGWVDPHVAEGVMASSLVAGSPKSHHDSSAYTHLHGRGGGRGANPRSCQMKVSKKKGGAGAPFFFKIC